MAVYKVGMAVEAFVILAMAIDSTVLIANDHAQRCLDMIGYDDSRYNFIIVGMIVCWVIFVLLIFSHVIFFIKARAGY